MKGTRLTALLGIAALVLAVAPAASAETVETGIDMVLVKTVDKAVASPGETLTYTITISHQGPSAPLQAAVVDTLPAGVTFVAASAGCTALDASTVECLTGPWLPNDPRSYTITVTIDEGASGTLLNTATVDHRDPRAEFPDDSDPSNNTDTAETVIPEPEPASIGDLVWLDANGDGAQDPGEAGIPGVTVTLSGDAAATAVTDANGLYEFADLAAGSYTVTVGAGPAGHLPTTPGSVNVTLVEGDVFLDADFGFTPPPPEPVIDLELTKSTATPSVTVGDSATFSVSVTNQGPDPATGVVVTDTLPAGLTFVSTTAGTEAGGVITVPVGDLAVGAEFVFSVTVTVDAIGAFTNAAEVTAADQDDVDSTPGDGQGDDYDTADIEASQVLANNSIGDFVWLDTDGDGVQDSGEEGIAGAVVTLTGATTVSTTTASDGKYLFSALDDGSYTISVDTASVDDDYSLTTVGSFTISVSGGETDLTADFGFTEVLPKTGADTRPLTILGVALILFGAALVTASRRSTDLI